MGSGEGGLDVATTMNDSEDPDKAAGLGAQIEAFVRKFMITPEQADEYVAAQERRYRNRKGSNGVPSGDPLTEEDKLAIARAIISRYATYTMWVGAGTAAPGMIPGWGTAMAVGGGVADVGATMKLQADMALCLVELFDETLSPEDAQDLAIVIALASGIEQGVGRVAKPFVEKTAAKLVYQYLRGPSLQLIKAMFRKLAITFTQKAAARAIPFGIGVAVAGGSNYVLTQIVGKVALKVLLGPKPA